MRFFTLIVVQMQFDWKPGQTALNRDRSQSARRRIPNLDPQSGSLRRAELPVT
jgi:hypothetical protein